MPQVPGLYPEKSRCILVYNDSKSIIICLHPEDVLWEHAVGSYIWSIPVMHMNSTEDTRASTVNSFNTTC